MRLSQIKILLAGISSFLYLQSSKAIERINSEKRTQRHEREVAEPFERGVNDAIGILNGQQPQSQPQTQNQNAFVSRLHTVAQGKVLELVVYNKGISDAIGILNGSQPQTQSQDDLVSQLHAVAQSKIGELANTTGELDVAKREIVVLGDNIDTKDRAVAELTQEKTELSNNIEFLTAENAQLNQKNIELELQLKELTESNKMAQEDKFSWVQRVKEASRESDQSKEV